MCVYQSTKSEKKKNDILHSYNIIINFGMYQLIKRVVECRSICVSL